MSDEYDDDVDVNDVEDGTPRSNAEWAALRKQQQAAKRAASERDAAKRELEFVRAGLDASKDPRLAYFVKGYDGEVSAEAIRAAAVSAGFVEAPSTGPSPEQQETLSASQRIDAAATGAVPPLANAEAAALAALDEAYNAAGAAGVMAKLAEFGIAPATD